MIIDIHAHIWERSYQDNKRDIIKACDKYNISKVFVSGLNNYYPDKEEIDTLNLEVYNFMREFPAKIEGYCYLNPALDNCLDTLEKGIEDYGMIGMKLWVATYCDDPRVYPLVEKCIDYDIPILVHSFHKDVGQLKYESIGVNVAKLANKYPESRIIMAHLGGNCYNGIKAIQECKNVFVDTSGSLFRRDDIDYTKRLIGTDRIIFGTDMPEISYLTNYGQIESANITDKEKEDIYYNNAINVFRSRFA